MVNIVIPMAGLGSRFKDAGYTFPKPLIDVNGKPMIQVVVENINIEGNYIFIVQKEHYNKYQLKYLLELITSYNNCEIIVIDGLTDGAAQTVLKAKEFINNDEELIIANSDQWVDWNAYHFLNYARKKDADGLIASFYATHPKWSFAKVDEDTGLVTEVAEKKPISNIATVGIYYYKNGKDFVKYANQMIDKNIKVNNEFYVCPVYNEYINDDKKIMTYHVAEMCGLGTPEDLNNFLKRT